MSDAITSSEKKLYETCMQEALDSARQAWGMTRPNPMVGAVVLDESGNVVGRGHHHKAGGPHAEVLAIQQAGERAKNGTIIVTLEPCSTYGRTPPCTECLIQSGIRRVVIGTFDPNPLHAGKAVPVLQKAGIEVVSDILTEECRDLNSVFNYFIVNKKPWVLLKMAMTLDGKIATYTGDSKWITGTAARERVQYLRRRAAAIMVGGNTVRADHPRLDVRSPEDWPQELQPRRIVFSQHLTEEEARTLLPPPERPLSVANMDTTAEWNQLLEKLGKENCDMLLLEGGGELAAAALQAGIVNEVEFHIAPKLLSGRDSRPVLGGPNPAALADAVGLEKTEMFRLGEDFAIRGLVKKGL